MPLKQIETNVKPITKYFILPMSALIAVKITNKMVDFKKRSVCVECYKDMDKEVTAFLIAITYLAMYAFDWGKSYRLYVFYAAALGALFMMVGIVNFIMGKMKKSMNQTPAAIGAEAAAKVAVETAENSTTVSEAKVAGAANGGQAAAEAAIDAGLSEKEVTEAVIAGQATGAVVAETVAEAKEVL